MKKLRCISSSLRKLSTMLFKEAFPHILLKDKRFIDFRLEKMDRESVHGIIDDILRGITIKGVPVVGEEGKQITTGEFNLNKDIDIDTKKDLEYKLKNIDIHLENIGKASTPLYSYDKTTHSYIKYQPAILAPEYTEKVPDLIKIAKKGVDYSYACTKVDLPRDTAKDIINWGNKNISDDILFTDDDSQGREDDIHITLFYGIKKDDPKELRDIFSKIKPFEVRLGLINAFKDRDDHDVIKIEAESGDLEKLHYNIRNNIDNKNDFPTYEPHITIAYVKKDSVNDLIGSEEFKGKTFIADNITFSPSEGKDIILSLAK